MYTKLHPPVERDSFYVVSAEILEEWTDRPEAWNFEVRILTSSRLHFAIAIVLMFA